MAQLLYRLEQLRERAFNGDFSEDTLEELDSLLKEIYDSGLSLKILLNEQAKAICRAMNYENN
jgi:hypothetical protein